MTTPAQKDFLLKALAHAQLAGHIWPEYAACEAALESAWGNSTLYRMANNVFGEKQHAQPIYDTLDLPTEEYVNGQWASEMAHWVKFPTLKEAFVSRMDTLRRLASSRPGYADALVAKNGEDYVLSVSRDWSTDPLRGQKVISIHRAHFDALGQII